MIEVKSPILSLLQTEHAVARAWGIGFAVVCSALWTWLTSVLGVAVAAFFLADLALGTLKSVHQGGIAAFDRDRFGRAFIKLAATTVGVALFVLGDVVLHETGTPVDWWPLTTAILVGACSGFFFSGLKSLTYFWPDAEAWVDGALQKIERRGSPEGGVGGGDGGVT